MGLVEHRFRQAYPRLFSRRKHAAPRVPERLQFKLSDELGNAAAGVGHPIDKPEDAEILIYGQIARDLRIYRREVRPRKGRAARDGDVIPFNMDGSPGGLQDPKDHVDRRRLSRPVRPEEADDLVGAHDE